MQQSKRKQMNRLSIQMAAIKLFSQKQYSDVTMDAIATEAGLTKRTLYQYFPSKLSLMSSIFEAHMQEEYIALSGAVYGLESSEEVILAAARALYEFTKDNIRFMRLLWSINDDVWGTEIPTEVFDRIKIMNDMLLNVGAERIAKMELHGVFANYTPREVSQFISAINKGIFLQVRKVTGQGIQGITTDQLFELALNVYKKCFQE